jgi:hypothetical protein
MVNVGDLEDDGAERGLGIEDLPKKERAHLSVPE